MEYSAGTSGKNESENGNVALDESKGNDKNDDMNSHSLRIAAKNDNSERIKKLLYEGADLETLKEATNNNSETIRMLSRNDTDTTDLQTALFQCVAEKDPESIVVLLLNYNYIEYEDDKKNLKKDCITPTINLAAQLGHYEVIDEIAHFLIQSKYVDREFPPDFDYYKNWIENWDPGKGEWDVVDEEEWDQFDEMSFGEFLLQRQSAISRFRVLSSPVHMSLRYLEDEKSENPLKFAYELDTKFQQRAKEEPEYRKEYLHLSERCKTFVTDLYKCCANMREIFTLFERDNINNHNPREVKEIFKHAIKHNLKEFVAHPNSQQILHVVYYGVPINILKMSFPFKMVLLIAYTILFPLLVLLYITAPTWWMSKRMTTPYFKLVSHISQFLLFLTLVAVSALRNNHNPSVLEYVILFIVIAMTIQEIREMLHHKPRRSYFFKWWNIVTIVMLTLYILGALLWIIGYAVTGGWSIVIKDYLLTKSVQITDGYQLLLVGNSIFSLAIVVSVFHLVDLCQVNSVLGPMQLSLYRMLRDVLKFLVLFSAIFAAFVIGVRNLYSYYSSIQAEIVANSVNVSVVVETNHPFSTFSVSTASMFWAIFDHAELADFDTKDTMFDITQKTGKFLFAFYTICIVMVALNMLIATMTHSYDSISEDVDIQWKYIRTQQLLEFLSKRSTLPAPYNLIPNIRAICRFFTKKDVGRHTAQNDDGESEAGGVELTGYEEKVNTRKSEKRKVIKRLVRRYLGRQTSQRKEES